MAQKRVVAIVVSLIFFFIVTVSAVDESITGQAITGKATNADVGASVTLLNGLFIQIISPENKTYIYGANDTEYPIDLNVTNDSAVESWRFTLENLDTHIIINNSVFFYPNITINATLGTNKVTVYANNSDGVNAETSVIFSVRGTNNAPEFGPIPSEVFACEGSPFNMVINATDIDADDLILDLSPKNPFFIYPSSFTGSSFVQSQIFSATLGKGEVGVHPETISVTDTESSDVVQTNITVIEINTPPSLTPVGVQTVWASGAGSHLSKQTQVIDQEDGNQYSGNLLFNVTYQNGSASFLSVSSTGVIDFVADESYLDENGSSVVYPLRLCVTDQGLESPHENISLCGQDGSALTSCNNFTLTVTGENRAPQILSYSPSTLVFSANSSDNLSFYVETYDPDWTIPDVYWYVNGALNGMSSGSNIANFNYTFGCGLSGVHAVRAVATDGELNASLQWNITLSPSDCPAEAPSSGGGGGGGSFCVPQWACDDWLVCDNLLDSLNSGRISGEQYRNLQSECLFFGWGDESCGYQSRECEDVLSCGRQKPSGLQVCYYTENPTCSDGIKNCHDGACEVLVDCGGSCGLCPSCSDGLQNQGEDGIDCGGSCPNDCTSLSPGVGFLSGLSGGDIMTLIRQVIAGSAKYFVILVILLLVVMVEVIQLIRNRLKSEGYSGTEGSTVQMALR